MHIAKKYPNIKKLLLLSGVGIVLCCSFLIDGNALDKVLQALARYRQVYPQEKIYMHLNQPYYLSGETLFFKGYVTNAHAGTLRQERTLVYVTLANAQGPLQTVKLLASNGLIQGHIPLPDTLSNGLYTLSAYTNFMRNFDKALAYQHILPIYNTKHPKPVHAGKKEGPALRFYPEGGLLVQNFLAKVGVQAKGAMAGRPVSGKIISSENEEVATFATDSTGLGTFFFTPKPGVSYTAITSEGNFALPDAQTNTAVLRVIAEPNRFRVVVNSSLPKEEELLLIAQAQGHVQFYAQGPGKGFATYVPKEELVPGINQLVLFNKQGMPLSERLVYVDDSKNILRLQLNDYSFRPRQQVVAQLSLLPAAQDIAYLSVSVNKRKSQAAASVSTLHLASEFTDLQYPLLATDQAAVLDDYLLTQKWERYNWAQLYDSLAPPAYTHERTLTVQGLLTDLNNAPLANTAVSITLPTHLKPYRGITDKDGRLQTPIAPYSGNEHIVIQPLEPDSLFNKLLFREALPEHAMSAPVPPYHLSGRLSGKLQEQVENRYIQQAYTVKPLPEKAADEQVQEDALSRIFTNSVLLKDYVSFASLREVIREIVTAAFVPEGKDEIKIYAQDSKTIFKGPPLILVDSVPTYNASAVLAIKPADIWRVGVIRNEVDLFNFSTAGKNGVIVINTTLDAAAHTFTDPNIVNYQGLLNPATFTAEPSTQDRIPDFRPVLYWNPMLQVTANETKSLAFTTSDEAGEFEIIVQGITKSGKLIYLKETIMNQPVR